MASGRNNSDMDFIIDNVPDSRKVTNPSKEQVADSLRQIDGETCCFFILTSESGSYIQCAGGQFGVTLEFREISGDKFKHFVLGKGKAMNPLKTIWSTVDCRIGPIRVHQEEVLTLDDAIDAFTYFIKTAEVLPGLIKRNVTNQFDVRH